MHGVCMTKSIVTSAMLVHQRRVYHQFRIAGKTSVDERGPAWGL